MKISPTTNFQKVVRQMNRLGASRQPFFFFFDFEMKTPVCLPLDELDSRRLLFQIENFGNSKTAEPPLVPLDFYFEKYPISFEQYLPKFEKVQAEIRRGNSFLANLTQPTSISTNLTLLEIFERSRAKFKLWWDERLVVFSPERFVQIIGNQIFTHPMKGTADASLPDAAARILASEKERAEHFTIVDLLRNDLNRVAKQVRVERFRYLSQVETERGSLLQVSSEIVGTLPANWHCHLGDIFEKLLPAGSICGAPKRRTVEIILDAEGYERGFYTGVFGVFDGWRLDSAVAIRFIERLADGSLVFKSGGGITAQSAAETEYQELIDKVYLPIVTPTSRSGQRGIPPPGGRGYKQTLLETIRIENGQPRNLRWHQVRFDHSRAAIFGQGLPKIDLRDAIFSEMKNVVEVLNLDDVGGAAAAVFKCRILYETAIQSIDFQKYTPRKIESLQLVEASELDYNLKWADRRELEKIAQRRGAADDVLMVKNGLITDTSYANVAFWDGSRWLTPATPLLAGTCRARLLAERRIFAADIRAERVFDFLKIRIFNSMLGWQGGVELPVSRVFPF